MFKKVATAASLSLVLGTINASPSNAASFSFTFQDIIYGNIGSGILNFDDSESQLGLSGGSGIFSLAQLGSSATFDYSAFSAGLDVTHTYNPSVLPFFSFTAGNLSGLYLTDTISNVSNLEIDSVFKVLESFFFIGPGISGVPILGASFGDVEFNTITPWQQASQPPVSNTSVPEPTGVSALMLLGLAGLFTMSKRSLKRNLQMPNKL